MKNRLNKTTSKFGNKSISCKCVPSDIAIDWLSWRNSNERREGGLTTHQRIHRVRILSPSSRPRNIRTYVKSESSQNISGREQTDSSTQNGSSDKKKQAKDDEGTLICVNPVEIKAMRDIHLNLISKITSLISNCKGARYGGFFSPNKLQRRINIGKFSSIPTSPLIENTKQLNPFNISKDSKQSANETNSCTSPKIKMSYSRCKNRYQNFQEHSRTFSFDSNNSERKKRLESNFKISSA